MTEYRQARFTPPDGATELLIIRHGESQPANPDSPFPLVDGQGDPELAPEGRAQAERVADRLADAGIQAVYVTNLRRTAQTAAPLAARLGLEPQVERDLREVHLGAWEGGLLRKKAAENDPIAVRMRAEERWDVIPGAESMDALAARVRAAVGRLAAANAGRRIAVVSHGGTIAAIFAQAAKSRPFAFQGADNASISHIVVTGDRWVIRCFNDTTHLTPAFTTAAKPLT
ncbi:MAG TPA: histidine phosphatase family protein [Streptosporangiaceae bacterium]